MASTVASSGPTIVTDHNFQNVDVTACKVDDADADLATADDQTVIEGW